MSKEYMNAFREARKLMGFTHTSAYVPSNRLADFSLYVERLKAERMLEICEMPPHSRERAALAQRNTTEIPTVQEVMAAVGRFPNQPSLNRQAQLCIKTLEDANAAMNVARQCDDSDEDRVKWMSKAVANNHMANVLWRELAHAIHQLEAYGEQKAG
jgi:hypothetical protein